MCGAVTQMCLCWLPSLSISIQLMKRKHAVYLLRGIRTLSHHFECLDASQPWLVYWIVHSMRLLGMPLGDGLVNDITELLSRCQAPSGGFGGETTVCKICLTTSELYLGS